MRFLPPHVKTIDKNTTLLGLSQNLLQAVVRDHLLLEILHDLGPALLLVFVPAHYRFEQALASELTHIHPKVHRLVELL